MERLSDELRIEYFMGNEYSLTADGMVIESEGSVPTMRLGLE